MVFSSYVANRFIEQCHAGYHFFINFGVVAFPTFVIHFAPSFQSSSLNCYSVMMMV